MTVVDYFRVARDAAYVIFSADGTVVRDSAYRTREHSDKTADVPDAFDLTRVGDELRFAVSCQISDDAAGIRFRAGDRGRGEAGAVSDDAQGDADDSARVRFARDLAAVGASGHDGGGLRAADDAADRRVPAYRPGIGRAFDSCPNISGNTADVVRSVDRAGVRAVLDYPVRVSRYAAGAPVPSGSGNGRVFRVMTVPDVPYRPSDDASDAVGAFDGPGIRAVRDRTVGDSYHAARVLAACDGGARQILASREGAVFIRGSGDTAGEVAAGDRAAVLTS